jgi:hypothetical protein
LSLRATPGLLGIPTDRATTEPAVKLSRDIAAALAAFREEPLASAPAYQNALAQLAAIAAESNRLDWDGHGALPVSPDALLMARRVILALPPDLDAPLIAAHPDGEVAMTWAGRRGTDFSLSIGPSGQMSYAAVFGPSVVSYGSDSFGDDLPASILDHLRRLR